MIPTIFWRSLNNLHGHSPSFPCTVNDITLTLYHVMLSVVNLHERVWSVYTSLEVTSLATRSVCVFVTDDFTSTSLRTSSPLLTVSGEYTSTSFFTYTETIIFVSIGYSFRLIIWHFLVQCVWQCFSYPWPSPSTYHLSWTCPIHHPELFVLSIDCPSSDLFPQWDSLSRLSFSVFSHCSYYWSFD